jgi:hypothetical protein
MAIVKRRPIVLKYSIGVEHSLLKCPPKKKRPNESSAHPFPNADPRGNADFVGGPRAGRSTIS